MKNGMNDGKWWKVPHTVYSVVDSSYQELFFEKRNEQDPTQI